ncbi:xanthine dehydrogenase family protein subunit M, partial [bacterium]|nr:xanthine dehydrogenase family protein subunit M [bacterium]
MPTDLDYLAPTTVEEAIALKAMPGTAWLMGGTDLLPQMRAGRKVPERLVDLKRIPGLHEIREVAGGGLSIGAAVPLADIETHPGVLDRFPLLAECAKTVGAWPLRQRATLGGNLCNASPAADTAVALLALDAEVEVASSGGHRSIPIREFFLGPGQAAINPGELVTEIVLPGASAGFRGTYLRLSRRKGMDLATVGVLVGKSNGALPARWRVALAAVAPTPLRPRAVEVLLEAEGVAVAAEAAAVAADGLGGAAY